MQCWMSRILSGQLGPQALYPGSVARGIRAPDPAQYHSPSSSRSFPPTQYFRPETYNTKELINTCSKKRLILQINYCLLMWAPVSTQLAIHEPMETRNKTREKTRNLTQFYEKGLYTIKMNFKRQHKDATMIRLHNDCDGQLTLLLSCPTGVVKPVYGIQTFRLTEKAVYIRFIVSCLCIYNHHESNTANPNFYYWQIILKTPYYYVYE